ncbi:MAG TPA: AraC family transcriptional regulator, partial [Acinetobacter ursingii]|nr:AraC family transcriptional regulator [Acinetobacter ursingii]
MALIKNYAGSVYGGLGHLLKLYCESQHLVVPPKLLEIQNLERFDYVIWRDLLEQIQQLQPQTGLGLRIA